MPPVETSRDAIEKLILAYAERIDRGDFAGVGELFADGLIAGPDGSPLARGRGEVQRLYERTTRRYEDGTPRTKHVTTNLQLDLDEPSGAARARSYYTVLQALPDFPLQPIVAGRYEDRFERAAGGWRFAERRMFVELVGDVSRHLLIALPRD
jgi:3-phenylpropionate/cinnamic acid dioxygenase small subunit